MQTSRYIVKRILLALVSLFAIITITYFLMNLMPGDPFMSEKASEENRAILIAKYGLDQPVYVQYGKYLENLLHGDMGTSYVLQKGRAVKDIIFESFQVSMGLGVRALLLAIVCGIILAVSQVSVRISCRMRSSVSFRRLEFRCLVMSSPPG